MAKWWSGMAKGLGNVAGQILNTAVHGFSRMGGRMLNDWMGRGRGGDKRGPK